MEQRLPESESTRRAYKNFNLTNFTISMLFAFLYRLSIYATFWLTNYYNIGTCNSFLITTIILYTLYRKAIFRESPMTGWRYYLLLAFTLSLIVMHSVLETKYGKLDLKISIVKHNQIVKAKN